MTRQDLIVGTIRTAVPGAISFLLVQLATAFPAVSDVIVSVDEVLAVSAPGFTVVLILNAAAFGLVLAAYYWVVRKIGARFPTIERWLLGSAKTPQYDVQGDTTSLELAATYGRKLGLTGDEIHADLEALAPKHRA